MDTAARLKLLLEALKMNPKSFSELCGYERPQAFYDILRGKTRNISSAMSEHILRAVPELNRTWLLTGDGPMMRGDEDSAAYDSDVYEVPLVPISAIAGPLKAYYEPGVALEKCGRVISPNANAELAIPVSGDSMEPVFADGSIIFIKRINETAFIPWGHAMVIDTENGVFIKKLLPDEENDSYIWAESLNPKYPRMHIPKYAIIGVYRVLSVQKSFTMM